MALGIDGRLYVSGNGDFKETSLRPHVLVVIDRPNEKGFDCAVSQREFNFGDGSSTIGLPNFMQHYFNHVESASVCQDESSIKVFPNPTTDFITIEMISGCDYDLTYSLFDGMGRLIKQGRKGEKIDMKLLAAGLYILQLRTQFGGIFIKKIIKQ